MDYFKDKNIAARKTDFSKNTLVFYPLIKDEDKYHLKEYSIRNSNDYVGVRVENNKMYLEYITCTNAAIKSIKEALKDESIQPRGFSNVAGVSGLRVPTNKELKAKDLDALTNAIRGGIVVESKRQREFYSTHQPD